MIRGINTLVAVATSPMVSWCSPKAMSVIFPPATVTVTGMGSITLKPYEEAVYTPSFNTMPTVSPMASFRAMAAAVLMPLLDAVAPEMPSTSAELAVLMISGSCSTAMEPMPSVSLSPTANTSVMAFASTVRVTLTSPPKPFAVAE